LEFRRVLFRSQRLRGLPAAAVPRPVGLPCIGAGDGTARHRADDSARDRGFAPSGCHLHHREGPAGALETHDRGQATAPGPMPKSLTATLANLLYFDKAALPQPLANRLIRLAAFQNPEFYRAQAMRLPVSDKPRVIGCAENFPKDRKSTRLNSSHQII